ncbi:MAG: PQQ-binding-like beta-propeller repeat protein [Sandaracinaceae bacterium]
MRAASTRGAAARRAAAGALAAAVVALGACGPALREESFNWLDGSSERPSATTLTIHPRWFRRLTTEGTGDYVPAERSRAALDPFRDRVYIGTSEGYLFAMTGAGAVLYRYDAKASIASPPVLDRSADDLYVGTENGVLHRLTASTGELAWRVDIGGAITERPLLLRDTVYIVADDDTVTAVERATGEPLWRVERPPPEADFITRHAGLALHDDRLMTGFTGGEVIALDPIDGALLWERDTTVDLEGSASALARFADVDTTPVVIGEAVYVASFAAGLYALELESGTVLWRDERRTGITAIAKVSDRELLLSSGDDGLSLYEIDRREVRWRKMAVRGAPSMAVVVGDRALFGETRGGLVTVNVRNGRELGRVELGHGIAAPPSVAAGRGFVLTNGGTFLAFALTPDR